MNRRSALVLAPFAATAAALAQGGAPETGGPCLPGSPVSAYRCETIPNTLTPATSIFASGATTVLSAPADDATVTVTFPSGFVFPYYGVARTSVGICSNGYLVFGSTTADFNNEHPGDGAVANDCIMPWHDDLLLTTAAPAGMVGYKLSSETPVPHRFIVEWHAVSTYRSGGVGHGKFTFQAVLFGSASDKPGRIEFKYDHLDNFDGDLLVMGPPFGLCGGFTSTYALGATIGLDDASGASATNHGVEPVDRGAASFYFPYTDIALIPVSFVGTEMDYAPVTPSVVGLRSEPFCSIVGRPGTEKVGRECGTGRTCLDDSAAPLYEGTLVHFPMFWRFNLHGRLFQSASVSPNGYLAFGAGQWTTTGAVNSLLPGTAEPDATIAPFWDDLEALCVDYPGAGLYWRVDGDPGCRVMTFEWAHFGVSTAPKGDGLADGHISFQVRFFEGSAGSVGCTVSGGLTVVPGIGNDRIEFLYDHLTFAPPSGATPFSATIGYENHKGTIGASLAGSPTIAVPPTTGAIIPMPAKIVIEQCDGGIVRTYGRQHPTTCPRELLGNGIPPRVGNPFALRMSGVSPSALAYFLFDLGGPLPGRGTPVECGGISIAGAGTLWVRIAPTTIAIAAGLTSPDRPGAVRAGLDARRHVDPRLDARPEAHGRGVSVPMRRTPPRPAAPHIGRSGRTPMNTPRVAGPMPARRAERPCSGTSPAEPPRSAWFLATPSPRRPSPGRGGVS
jgi:hypothetical protein